MSKRLYVGKKLFRTKPEPFFERFWSEGTPSLDKYGERYAYVTGPFSCVASAEWFINHSFCTTVAEAEEQVKMHKLASLNA